MYTSNLYEQIEDAINRSAFYRNKIKDGYKNICEIPFTTKEEILIDQKHTPPFGSNLAVSPDKITRIHKTSGTTKVPVIVALTNNDIANVIDIGKKSFAACGVTSSNTIIHCLNFCMWAGGVTDHLSLEATGAAVIPFGVGHTKNLIETIMLLNVDTIHCTPSYLSKIEQVLNEEFQMEPRDLKLKLGLFGAESGLQNPTFRAMIEKKWGFSAYNANYGMSEVLSIMASECRCKRGLHFRASSKIFVELFDVSKGEIVPIERSARGEMVFTNLCKDAQPLIRYRSGDIIEVLDVVCQCGDEGFLFEIIGRTDDLIVVKGLNVFVSAIEKVVSQYHDEFSGIFEILISKNDPIEEVVILLERKQNDNSAQISLMDNLKNDLKTNLYISVDIKMADYGELARYEGKTKRVKRVL